MSEFPHDELGPDDRIVGAERPYVIPVDTAPANLEVERVTRPTYSGRILVGKALGDAK